MDQLLRTECNNLRVLCCRFKVDAKSNEREESVVNQHN